MGSIAKNQGLHAYDMETVAQWAMQQMHVARDVSGRAAADPKAMIGEFINRNLDSMIRVRDGSVDLKSHINEPRNVKGRLEYTGDTLTSAVVSAKSLTDYCNASNIDSSWLIVELKRLGVTDGISKSSRLATGTNFPNPTIRSYVIDLSLIHI